MAMYNMEFLKTDININRNETELQIFTEYFNVIDKENVKKFIEDKPGTEKSKELSTESRIKGHLHYKEKNYSLAIGFYQDGITYAPRNSIEYGLSMASRSAVLFQLKRYKECLLDINSVFKTEYPHCMLCKIFMREAKCYLALKCYGKASKAIQKAKYNLETLNPTLTKKDKDDIANQISDIEIYLKSHSNTDTPAETTSESDLPELTEGENPRFICASSTVDMKKNEHLGRYVIATTDIKRGDVIFVEKPFSTSFAPDSFQYGGYCSFCFSNSLTCIPCTSCILVLFCSDQCREQYWNTRHRWECAGFRKNIITTKWSLVLGILFQASRTGFKTTITDAEVYGNRLDNYPHVNQLMTHKNDMTSEKFRDNLQFSAVLTIYLIHFTDYFDWLYSQEIRPDGSLDELYRIIGAYLLQYACIVETHKEQVVDFCVSLDSLDLKFCGDTEINALYVSSSLINHSCMPNTEKSFQGCTKIVRALVDIKKGSEITVNYLDNWPPPVLRTSRKEELQKKYYFTCTCYICSNEKSLFPWVCGQCRGRAQTLPDEKTAQCIDCQYIFRVEEYEKLQTALFVNIIKNHIEGTNPKPCLESLNHLFYKTNPYFLLAYGYVASYYKTKGEYILALEYIDLQINSLKTIYGDIPSFFITMLTLDRCLTLTQYCLSLKHEKPDLHKKVLKEAEEAISGSTELLKYHARQTNIDIYQRYLLDVLNGGAPNVVPVIYLRENFIRD